MINKVKKSKTYVCDFETTTTEPARVWAAAGINIDNLDEYVEFNNLFDFMEWMLSEPRTVYFHNAKFDSEFIYVWLLENGYEWANARRLDYRQFKTLITDLGQNFSTTIKCGRGQVKILDSLKLIPFSVAEIAGAFGLGECKGDIDYTTDRPEGHIITDEEHSYIYRDVVIVAKALKIMFSYGIDKMTIASSALAFYQKLIGGKKVFDKLFPTPANTMELKQAYKGGFVYCSPIYQNKEVGAGVVLDVNSLYPSVMRNRAYPVGVGVAYGGQYKKNKKYPLYIQCLTCNFKIKSGYLPTIQLKGYRGFFSPTEYITDSKGEDITLLLTCFDLRLFLEHYEVENIVYHGGYMYRSRENLFTEYVDYWTRMKIEATKEGNKPKRTIAKLMLNSLYGKFGTKPIGAKKQPVLINGAIKYKTLPPEERDAVYMPVAAFVTSYAREVTITAAQANIDRFLYSDTDSLHLLGGIDDVIGCTLSKTELGMWDHESSFVRAKFIRAKTYIEESADGEINIACAGMPKACYQRKDIDGKMKTFLQFEDFYSGAEFAGKLVPKHVKGGVILTETTFKIQS